MVKLVTETGCPDVLVFTLNNMFLGGSKEESNAVFHVSYVFQISKIKFVKISTAVTSKLPVMINKLSHIWFIFICKTVQF